MRIHTIHNKLHSTEVLLNVFIQMSKKKKPKKQQLQISSNIGSWYKLYRTIIRLKACASDLCLDWSQESYSSRIPNSAELN